MVYFIYNSDMNLIKIGTSTKVQQRIKTLEYQFKCKFTILLIMNGSYGLERKLHRKFKSLRYSNEFYTYDTPIKEYIQRRLYLRRKRKEYDTIKYSNPAPWD